MKDFYEKLKQRDESAIQKLYNDYVKLVYHIAYSYTKNKEDSEDIVSEVFTKIKGIATITTPFANYIFHK